MSITENIIYKSPEESSIETRYVVMPDHANHYGTAFGGVIMSWIDMVAAMVAQRHCGKEAVTISVDRLTFIHPINIGDHVILKASVNYTGNTSMEIGVQVLKENPYKPELVRTTTAYLTFVALDENKKPTKVPTIQPKTADEIRRFENAKLRIATMKELSKKIKSKQ
ncbi:acyl-CoA thioesterase [Leptospira sp. GIMC2001]|uniref:acyl-CoA thioesterase n=1 Tax=Leptospira sp. GIMC2001 TaxID=1513297 RepID=UPI00234B5271|nr:acyl-CoA thioesterase [Leptospira sp. GIMC2001]WCL48976.1 acyl-CoA thioesterase [Leptospira sp. GIMC2001]